MHTIGNMASASTWLNWQCNQLVTSAMHTIGAMAIAHNCYMGDAHNWQHWQWLHRKWTQLAKWPLLFIWQHGHCNQLVTWAMHTIGKMAIAFYMSTWPLQPIGYMGNAQNWQHGHRAIATWPMHFHGYIGNAKKLQCGSCIHCSCLYPLHMASNSLFDDQKVYLIDWYE